MTNIYRKRFLTVFPDTCNVHLIKDVGMIPYYFYSLYGYDSAILTYKNGEYPLLESELRGLKLVFLPDTEIRLKSKTFEDIEYYIRQNAVNIDILNFYDISAFVLKLFRIYKKLNPLGKVYIKLDRGFNYTNSLNPFTFIRQKMIELMYNKADLISIESTTARAYFRSKSLLKLSYIPNGFKDAGLFDPTRKKHTILFVGDVSISPKRLDLIVQAFLFFKQQIDSDYTLRLVGPIKADFETYFKTISRSTPFISEISIVGPQYDRSLLNDEYAQASIFVLASDHESFGIVLPESIRFGCIPVISSGVASAIDITANEKLGFIFKKGSTVALGESLIQAYHKTEDLLFIQKIVEHAEVNFYWPNIIQKIYNSLGLNKNG